ncbi:GNAT family N-acetyltransferase [Vibrio sp. MEBiC08052]|uniref:GNAT family N-acetyltransferase n=1 Tax=Vibrio sp. MEBiC08052 TaxID=1761910 RepID=UPI0007408826|nr:GNAT family N-acetyltransferase [Vibrio sp. MEBiC08052]KUI99715.1 putative acetyltransferase [Vibrio sp. MEBiC08052]
MKIRNAEIADLDAVLVLSEQIGMLHFENAPLAFKKPSAADKPFWLNVLNDESTLFLLAETERQVVGFLTATITKNETIPFIVSCPICCIRTIVVDEKHRASGIGTKLMSACERWAKSQGAEQIRLEVMAFNQSAQQFYQQLGFQDQSHIMCRHLNSTDLTR